jgi:hypothetical protein
LSRYHLDALSQQKKCIRIMAGREEGTMKMKARRVFATALFAASAVLLKSAGAEDLLSGHIGIATPIVTWTGSNGTSSTTTIGNNFNILFPFGIGLQPQSSPVIFDFEFDPAVNPSTRSDSLTLSPGVLLPLQYGWIVGMRAAFDIDQNSVGFTPLVHKNFPLFPGSRFSWFLEGDVPVRFLRLPNGADATSVGFLLHAGLAF